MASVNFDSLRKILLDREQGAAVLLRRALNWLGEHPTSLASGNREAILRILRQTRAEMSGFATLAAQLAQQLERANATDAATAVEQLKLRLHQDESSLVAHAVQSLSNLGARHLVTLSFSSSVAAVLEDLATQIDTVNVLESYPGGEGRALAQRLSRSLTDVRLHPDSAMKEVVRISDAGVIGADSLFSDGSILNKVLSTELGRLLHDSHKPFLVLATTWKRAAVPVIIAKDFELVPANYITHIVTESN